MERLRITIAAGTVAADLVDFPVVVRLPEAAAAGGFSFADSGDRELPWVPFGAAGKSLVRVLLPEVAAAADTVFFAVRGGSGSGGSEDPFTRSCRFPASEESPGATDKSSDGTGGGSALTVESWIHAGESRSEQMQVIASQWPLAAALERFATYDAGATDGLETRGFFGAMCDGRYVYFSPQCNTTGRHGTALRYDTHDGFDDPGSWSAYDAGRTSGLDTTGYYGVACTGRYVYYVPRHNSAGKLHTAMLRYDAGNDGFRDPEAWSAFDLGPERSSQGCAFDGRYVYYVPGYEGGGGSCKVIRYDTEAPFDEADSYETWDAGNTGGVACSCYDGAVFDGRHVYFAPLSKRGNMLRYDTRRPFAEPASWEAHDIRGATDPAIAMCVGAVFDGRHVYYVPYGDNTAVVRYDTETPFGADTGWESRDVAGTSGLECRGFDGALFDGRYVYFIPFYNGGADETGFHCELLRYDTRMAFDDDEAWSAADGSLLAPPNPGGFNGGGFNGGAFDGRFLYCAPWRKDGEPGDPTGDGTIFPHGQVLRYDTAGDGARFLLKYMDCGHNGGLGASVPGPVFTVNTETGPVSARANCNPGPGWHHVAGVYDGEEARIYIDGRLAATANGKGDLAASGAGVQVGELEGCSRLAGDVAHLRVEERVRSGAWIRAAAGNMRAPDEFARVSEEP